MFIREMYFFIVNANYLDSIWNYLFLWESWLQQIELRRMKLQEI